MSANLNVIGDVLISARMGRDAKVVVHSILLSKDDPLAGQFFGSATINN